MVEMAFRPCLCLCAAAAANCCSIGGACRAGRGGSRPQTHSRSQQRVQYTHTHTTDAQDPRCMLCTLSACKPHRAHSSGWDAFLHIAAFGGSLTRGAGAAYACCWCQAAVPPPPPPPLGLAAALLVPAPLTRLLLAPLAPASQAPPGAPEVPAAVAQALDLRCGRLDRQICSNYQRLTVCSQIE